MVEQDNQDNHAPPKRPGTKRLSVVVSLVAYIICGIPVWWATTSLQRCELPHAQMQRAGELAQGRRHVLPVALQVYWLLPGDGTAGAAGAAELLAVLQSHIKAELPDVAAGPLTLSAVVESSHGACAQAGGEGHWPGSRCLKLGRQSSEWAALTEPQLDDALEALLQDAAQGKPGTYTLFVIQRDAAAASSDSTDSGARLRPHLTVGRYRHAWLRLPGSEPSAASAPPAAVIADAASQLLRSCFALGARAGGQQWQLPLSAAAHSVLSFTLLNADPRGGVVTWDFGALHAQLQPALQALCPVALLSVDSQVLHYTAARTNGTWSPPHGGYTLQPEQLPFLVDSEWNLLAGRGWGAAASDGACPSSCSAAAAPAAETCTAESALPRGCLQPGEQLALLQPHVLHFLVYVPPRWQQPLLILGPDRQPSPSNSFWMPSWGSVIVANPPDAPRGAASDSATGAEDVGTGSSDALPPRRRLDDRTLAHVAGTVLAHMRALLGLSEVADGTAASGGAAASTAAVAGVAQTQLRLLPSPVAGFADWEVDALLRHRIAEDVVAIGKVLDSLRRMVQELPNLEMPPLIGEQVHQSLEALAQAQLRIAAGDYAGASATAQAARAAAEAASLHPAVLAQLNFPQSHKLGIYMPLFLPVTVPVLQGLLTEVLRSVRRWREYRAAVAALPGAAT